MTDVLAQLGVPAGEISKFTASDIDAVTKTAYLPRLQVCNASSEIVQNQKAGIGAYALVTDKDNVTDIGREIDIIVIAFRPKALRIPPAGNPLSYFNIQADAFKKVMADSNFPNSGCMYGPEFLVWVPKQGQLATFFLGSKSGRKASSPILAAMKQPDGTLAPAAITLRSTTAKNTKGVWQVPVPTVCSTPLEPLPDPDELREELEKFNNPPESVIEPVAPAAEGERAR